MRKEARALSVCNIDGVGVTGYTYNGGYGMNDVFVLKIVPRFP